jgi:hypothetical protein
MIRYALEAKTLQRLQKAAFRNTKATIAVAFVFF